MSEKPSPPSDATALDQLRATIQEFKDGTPKPRRMDLTGLPQREAENIELAAIHKTLNVVLAEIEKLAASRERPTPEPTTITKENTMQPTIGRILHYRLSEQDVAAMTRRRTTSASIAARMKNAIPPQEGQNQDTIYGWPAGAQAHIGNPVSVGAIVPLIVVVVWPNEFGHGIPGVNGQALLDGNDALWVTSAKEGTEPGTWSWPTRS